ncbi:hypothetical protein FIE12Z_12684 [Fusarium flagelliforme]|uniref:Uncharacterized protein n=1 Tax=Fusarium flagelliforme TaxID=2675880 RepID=A0A395M5C0_9HYPO|nr:hypothetical protein FIE12Z_12684 [Fusarium flagelliforme]
MKLMNTPSQRSLDSLDPATQGQLMGSHLLPFVAFEVFGVKRRDDRWKKRHLLPVCTAHCVDSQAAVNDASPINEQSYRRSGSLSYTPVTPSLKTQSRHVGYIFLSSTDPNSGAQDSVAEWVYAHAYCQLVSFNLTTRRAVPTTKGG